MEKCTTCFVDYLVQCTTEINVFAKLTPETIYQWVITDKFSRQYSGTFETDADGFWAIPVSELPEGMLTEYSGTFTLQVFDEPYGQTCAEPITFKIAQTFDCIVFNVRAGTREKNYLGCEF
jgi:hypothetical protein